MRFRRIAAFGAAAVLLCTLLSGCSVDVDDMRSRQFFQNEDNSMTTASGEVYLPFPLLESITADDELWEMASLTESRTGYITEPDVPLLLMSLLGPFCEISNDKVFMKTWYGSQSGYALYCRSSDYAAMLEKYHIHMGQYDEDGTVTLDGISYQPLPQGTLDNFDEEIWNDEDTAVAVDAKEFADGNISRCVALRFSVDRLLLCDTNTKTVFCRSDRYDESKDIYRPRVGFFEKDGNVTLEGVLYKKLPGISRDYWRSEVPFAPCYHAPIKVDVYDDELIDESPYHAMYLSFDGVLMECFYSSTNDDKEGFYCREDAYDELMKRIYSKVTYTHYGYSLDESFGKFYDGSLVHLISNEGAEAINAVLATVTPVADNGLLREAPTLFLQDCTEDLFFVTSAGLAIMVTDDGYVLAEYSGEDIVNYPVPEQYVKAFDALTAHWRNSGKPSMENV